MNRPTGGAGSHGEELPETPPSALPATTEEEVHDTAVSTAIRARAQAERRNEKVITAPFDVDILSAIKAGIFASLIFTLLWYPLVFVSGEDGVDLALVFGAFITPQIDILTQILGFGALIGTYTGIAVSYAVLLRIFRIRSNAGKGTVFGFLVFVPMIAFFLPWLIGWVARFGVSHASIPQADVLLNQAGHSNFGWEVPAAGLIAHLAFGAILGALYRDKPVSLNVPYRVEYVGG